MLVTEEYVRVVGEEPTGNVGPGATKNLHCPVFPNGAPNPATKRAINAASFDEIAPLPLTSAATLCLSFVNGSAEETCCAIRAASADPIPFCPVVFDSETVYEPEPNPVSVYCPAVPPGAAVVVKTFGEPVPVTVTFEIYFGGAAALPSVTVPLIEAVPGVAVAVAVAVGVEVDVAVEVGVEVAVGVAAGWSSNAPMSEPSPLAAFVINGSSYGRTKPR